jgi:hypothetical protein
VEQEIELSLSDIQWVVKALAHRPKRLDENNNEVVLPPSDIKLRDDIRAELRAATGDTITLKWGARRRNLVANALTDELTCVDARTRKPIHGEATRDALTKLTMKFR